MLRNNSLIWDRFQVVERIAQRFNAVWMYLKIIPVCFFYFFSGTIFLTLKIPYGWFANKNLNITVIRENTRCCSIFYYFPLIFTLI